MRIWLDSNENQMVVQPDGGKEHFITPFHARMEFNDAGTELTIIDLALPVGSSSNLTALVADVKNQAGSAVGDYAAVRDYLLAFIGK